MTSNVNRRLPRPCTLCLRARNLRTRSKTYWSTLRYALPREPYTKELDQPRRDLFSLSHTPGDGSILLGTRRSPILVLSRCTLFLDGLAPRYQFPFASNRCVPNESPRKSKSCC